MTSRKVALSHKVTWPYSRLESSPVKALGDQGQQSDFMSITANRALVALSQAPTRLTQDDHIGNSRHVVAIETLFYHDQRHRPSYTVSIRGESLYKIKLLDSYTSTNHMLFDVAKKQIFSKTVTWSLDGSEVSYQ